MKALLNDFVTNKINLVDFIKSIQTTKYTFNEQDIHNTLESYNDEEKSALAYLLLYYIYKYNFTIKNDFIYFLDSIKYETANDFNKDIKFHLVMDNVVIFQIDKIFFILNNNEDSITVTLPDSLKNDYQFCINCNHELYFKEHLVLESYEFYMISIEK